VDWIDLALDRQVAGYFIRGDELASEIKCGEIFFLLGEALLALQEGICCMELVNNRAYVLCTKMAVTLSPPRHRTLHSREDVAWTQGTV